MPQEAPEPARIDPHQLTREFERIRTIPNELERTLELAQLCLSLANRHGIETTTIHQLYEQYDREASLPAMARPFLRASRKLWTTQEALKNIALISAIASAISFFAAQNEARTLFIQKQWELAEAGPRSGPLRISAIETLAAGGHNLGRLSAPNTYLAGLRLPTHTKLQGAHFNSSNLFGSSLIRANLYFADFSTLPGGPFTNLENSNLSGSDLRQARLVGAYMKKACFREANLELAKLDRAVISEADFRGAKGLKASQLRNTIGAKTALYDTEIARAIGAKKHSPSNPEPASCHLPAKPRNILARL